MPALSPRVAASVLVVGAAFLAGIVFDELGHREARAQSLTASTIVVPEGGLYFRAPDGTLVARLSRDAHGGSFELFDGKSLATTELRPNPYVVDAECVGPGQAGGGEAWAGVLARSIEEKTAHDYSERSPSGASKSAVMGTRPAADPA